MKVYLIGYLYDDFSDCGFHILNITSTIERAKILLRHLEQKEPDGGGDMGYEIREWEVDNANPVGEVIHHECVYGGEKFTIDRVIPYKVIKEEECKND